MHLCEEYVELLPEGPDRQNAEEQKHRGGHGQHPPRQEAPPPAGGTAALQGLQSLIKLLGEYVLRLLGRFEKGVVIVKD